MGKLVVVDERRCLGCKSCELACALAHSRASNLGEAVAASPRPKSRIYVEPTEEPGLAEMPGGTCFPLQCRHCEDAPCLAACPSGAIYRPDPDGPVLVEVERCIGCRFCMAACPFGVIEPSPDGRAVVKCDLCVERTRAGELPACVAACPTGALEFVEMDQALRRRRRRAARRLAEASSTDPP